MLVLMRVMNSTYFFVLRDCCCGVNAVVGVVAVVVVVGGVAVEFVLGAELFWLGGLAVESAADVDGAGVGCGEVLLGGAVCWGDWGAGLRPAFCRIVASCSRRLLTWRRASTRCWSSVDSPPCWRAGSADWEGTSEVGVDWAEGGLVGAAVAVIVEEVGG